MPYTRQNRDVIHALIESQGESLRNTSHTVLSGCDVTVNTGDLGSGNNTLSVASGEVLLGGTAAVSVASQSVSLPAANSSYPRWDLVVVDESTQAVEVRSGDPTKPNRGGERLRARNVLPPDLAAQDATPLALVWIPAGANSIDSNAPSEDIFDVRPMQTVPRVDADATQTGQFNRGTSYRSGATVYYNPADSGPYVDGADAFTDVPDGGTFTIAAGTDYDVPSEGTLSRDFPVRITGEGWGANTNNTQRGSRIVNTGASAVDAPVIEFNEANQRDDRLYVEQLAIEHEGASSPAILINNTARTVIRDNYLTGNGVAPIGVKTEGQSFFLRVLRNHVQRFTDIGIWDASTGFATTFQDNHVQATEDVNPAITGLNGPCALRTHQEWVLVLGGEYVANVTSNEGIAVQLFNPLSRNAEGGYVMTSTEKTDVGVDITGDTNRKANVIVDHLRANLANVGTGVRFGMASGSQLRWPAYRRANGGGNAAAWTADASHCGVVSQYGGIGNAALSVASGASNPYIIVPQVLSNGLVSNLPTDPNLYVGVNWDRHETSPVFHDGSDWHQMHGGPTLNSGTVSIAASGSASVSTTAGAGVPVGYDYWVATDPNGAPVVDATMTYDETNEVQLIEFTESGGVGVDVGWEVYRQDGVFVP